MITWFSNIKRVDSRKDFSKDDIIYLVLDIKSIDVKPEKLKIQYLEYDAEAPIEHDFTEIVCRDTSYFKKRKYKVPHHWVGKTKKEAVKNYFKYREQFKKKLESKLIK